MSTRKVSQIDYITRFNFYKKGYIWCKAAHGLEETGWYHLKNPICLHQLQTGHTEDTLIHIISYSLEALSFVGLFGMLSFSVKLHID